MNRREIKDKLNIAREYQSRLNNVSNDQTRERYVDGEGESTRQELMDIK